MPKKKEVLVCKEDDDATLAERAKFPSYGDAWQENLGCGWP